MQIAKGGKSWILLSFSVFIILLISMIITKESTRMIFLLFCLISGVLCILFLMFFRDPKRKIGKDIVAVADGSIREIKSIKDKDIGNAWFISTFMNIHNVHVNRMPITGKIKKITHISGSHLPAFKKESSRNERVIMIIETILGEIKIILIAGTLARRIVPYKKKNDHVKKGEKLSLIRLGSRVDVYLPKKNTTICIKKKDKIKAGASPIATSNV